MKLFLTLLITIAAFNLKAQDAQSHYTNGMQKLQSGDYEKAIADFTKAVTVDPKFLNGYLQRAFCYSATNKYDLAVKDYDAILAVQPNQKFALNSRGSAKNKLKKYDEAIADFDKAISLDAKFAEAYNNRGWAKDGKGDHDGACQDWNTSKKMGNEEAKIILKNTHCKK